MATNSSAPLTITDLDFDSILANFRNYLKSQTVFQDYNFEGSALSELLKLLSYNTFYNAFYINNIANEMYLDSASNRSAVVSRAKSLGYVPTSTLSSTVYVDFVANILKQVGDPTPSANSFISLNQYSSFTTSVNNTDYSFLTPQITSLYYSSDGGAYWEYKASNIKIVEGANLNYAFTVSADYEQYVIPNGNIDLNSLVVRVFDSHVSSSYATYARAQLMTDSLTQDSLVYWVYEGIDGKYYLQFGNGDSTYSTTGNHGFGKKLNIGNIIYVEYITTNGNGANGAKIFSPGNYSYSNPYLDETSALSVTASDYTILTITNPTGNFTVDSYVVGANSFNTSYVYNYNSNTEILTLYSSANTFILGEIVSEQTIVGANTVIGVSATVASSRTQTVVSVGGSNIESISNIKLNAPKLYASQNRLITASDYESIIKHEYPYIDDIICWGSEDEVGGTPGTVYVAIKPKGRETLEDWEKTYITQNIIADRKIISLATSIEDPDYVYIYPSIDVKYSSDTTSSTTQNSVETAVKNSIYLYSLLYLNNFNNIFYYSPFCSIIDNSNEFILGDDTTIELVKKFRPNLNVPYTEGNPAVLKYSNIISGDYDDYKIRSSVFTISGYTDCYLTQNSINFLLLSVLDGNGDTVILNAGSIDYGQGTITINNVTITSTTLLDTDGAPLINIFVKPESNDLVCTKNQILSLYPTWDNITAIPVKTKK